MEIRDLLKADLMVFDLKAEDKMGAIKEIAKNFYEKGYAKSEEDFKKGLVDREAQGSTALGESVAIPHTKKTQLLKSQRLCLQRK